VSDPEVTYLVTVDARRGQILIEVDFVPGLDGPDAVLEGLAEIALADGPRNIPRIFL
jgi:hypothetical protein